MRRRGRAALAGAGPARVALRRCAGAAGPLMRFRPATDADAAAWQTFLAATASGDFLHDWAWADVAAFDGQPPAPLRARGRRARSSRSSPRRRDPLLGGRAFWYVPHGPVLDFDAPAGRRSGCGRSSVGLRRSRRAAPRDRREARAAPRRWTTRRLALFEGRDVRPTPRHAPGRADADRRAGRRRRAARGLRQGHALLGAARRARGRRGLRSSTTPRTSGDRRPPRPRGRDAARAPASRCRRSSATGSPGDALAGAGRARDPRGTARWRAARVGHGRHRGRSVVLPVQRLPPRGARRAEALRELRAPVGDDAARPRARRRGITTCGASRRPDAGPDHPWHGVGPLQEGLRRPRGALGRIAGTSSWTRASTGCATRRGIARGWLRGLRR